MGCIDNSAGCGCHISAGSCFSVTGDGSAGNPYVISVVIDPSGSNALVCGGPGLFVQTAVPPGATFLYPSNTPPAGYLACLGQAVDRTTYANLNAIASAAGYAGLWGPGNGVSTFNVPNMQGMVPVGVSGSDPSFTLGATGGEKTHTLLTAEMPSHNHDVGVNLNAVNVQNAATAFVGSTYPGSWPVSNTGGGGAHNNLQPYRTFAYIIKT